MLAYLTAVALHVILALCWIGTLVYTLRAGPAERSQTAGLVTLGWVCLAVALLTGWFMLRFQGLPWSGLTSGDAFQGRFGRLLSAKLALVGLLLLLQIISVRANPSIRVLQLVAGVAVVVLSVAIVR